MFLLRQILVTKHHFLLLQVSWYHMLCSGGLGNVVNCTILLNGLPSVTWTLSKPAYSTPSIFPVTNHAEILIQCIYANANKCYTYRVLMRHLREDMILLEANDKS